jgi:glycosyltransferase involved in cell wall biosynthesis
MDYVVVTPVRNEEEFIHLTLESMVNQTVLPAQWVIVNDGSTDNTAQIVEPYARKCPWIKLVDLENQGTRERGGRVVRVFREGFSHVDFDHYDVIVKLDGDLSFGPGFFETLLQRFAENPNLGMAGGVCYVPHRDDWRLEKAPSDHVRGPTKVYRMECFEEIGGLVPVDGWDNIDEWRAQMKGWETRGFEDLKVLHHRPTGAAEGTLKGRVKQGENSYFLGYSFPLIVARSIYRAIIDPPRILCGLAILWGYTKSWITRKPQFGDEKLQAYLHKRKWAQLLFWRS